MKYLLFPLLVLDVAVNVLLCFVGAIFALDPSMFVGSWNHTLSARAGSEEAKHQRYFAWTAGFIDFLFGNGHCAAQWRTEQMCGSVWASWASL